MYITMKSYHISFLKLLYCCNFVESIRCNKNEIIMKEFNEEAQTQEVLNAFFENVASKDPESIASLFAENIDSYIYESKVMPWTGKRSKRSEMPDLFRSLFAHFVDGEEKFEVKNIFIQGQEAIVSGKAGRVVKSTGKWFETPFVMEFTIVEKLIVRFHMSEETKLIEKAFEQKDTDNDEFTIFGVAISVSNLENSIKWYHDILGFNLLERTSFSAINAKGAFIEGAGIRIELLESANGFRLEQMFANPPEHIRPVGNKAMILYVDDLSKTSEDLKNKGVDFAFRELELNNDGLISSVIRDVDGNFISIFEKTVSTKYPLSK